MTTKMIYDLIKKVKDTGNGADGTVVCSMDELVALVDYVEKLAYKDGFVDGCNDLDGCGEAYENGYEVGYELGCKHGHDDALREWAYDCEDEDDYDDYEDEDDHDEDDECEDEDDEPTLEDLFKEFMAMYMAKGR